MLFCFKIADRPIFWAIFLWIALSTLSCSGKPDNELAAFKALDENLINSNIAISRSTETIHVLLQQKLSEPGSSYKAAIWEPKASAARKFSADITKYLEDIKSKLKEAAGFKSGDDSFNGSSKNAVRKVLNNKASELYEKLKGYRNDMLTIDSQINITFRDKFILTTNAFDTLENKSKDSFQTFFENIPVVAALAILSQFQNNIKINENRVVQFCHNKVGITSDYFTTYRAIIGQSSTVVGAGERIDVTAGVGYFSVRYAQPTITFNGKKIDINESGVAVYSFKAPLKPGKYSLPVKVNFTDEYDQKQILTENVAYTVK